MSTKKWGPPTWTFIHCLIEKIKDEKFNEMRINLINFIKVITFNLPCPECSKHSASFFSRVNFNIIQSKDDLKNLIYIFHNVVNKKNNKPLFNVSDLSMYKNINIIVAYNNFINVYKTDGNMKLLADNFQRKNVIKQLKFWLIKNINNFNS